MCWVFLEVLFSTDFVCRNTTKNISWCTHFTLGYYGMFVLLWLYLLRKMWFLHVGKWTLRYVFLLFSLLFWATWVTFIFVRKIDAEFFLSYSCKNNCQNSCTYFHLIFLCNLSKNYILKKFLSEIKVSHTDINMFFIIFFLVRWSVLQTWAAYLRIHNLENPWFFCQSDFTWNQFWSFWRPINCHFDHLSSYEFWGFLKFSSVKFPQKPIFKASKVVKTAVLDLLKSATIDFM